MHKGTFTKFFVGKGFGFIVSTELDGDIFAHIKHCHVKPGTCPRPGDQCLFDVEDGPRGPHAINVRITYYAEPDPAGSVGYVEYAEKGSWRRHSGD
jgi:cold shock CspA family protein